MDAPSGVFLLHSSFENDPSTLPQGCSGISISTEWILTHGTALVPFIERVHAMSSFIADIPPGELTVVPRELELKFRIYSRLGDHRSIEKHDGVLAAAWRCSLLKETFDDFFKTWSFPDSSKFDRSLRSLFLLVRVCDSDKLIVKTSAERALSCLLEQAPGNLIRGSSVEIESTPFGNPVFMGSIARGVISNVVGDKDCVIMTDTYAFPGSEGGPVYIIPPNSKRKIISGMVIAPLSWCRGEWVDYTFAANLAACVFNVLEKSPPRFPIVDRENTALDKGVVLVKCGINWGTGVLVHKDTGTFLTCSHVVAEAPEREISIVMRPDKVDSRVQAKLLYRTPDNQPYDVAVLRVNPKDVDSLESVRLSPAPILKGEPVVSIGFPFSSSIRPTISSGVVSKSIDCAILTTCCVQSGTSGGPIISQRTGDMLGMVVCNVLSSDGTVLYSRMSLAVSAATLNGPLQEYLRTNNPKVLRAFTCNDGAVRKVWDFYPFVPAKL